MEARKRTDIYMNVYLKRENYNLNLPVELINIANLNTEKAFLMVSETHQWKFVPVILEMRDIRTLELYNLRKKRYIFPCNITHQIKNKSCKDTLQHLQIPSVY